MLVHDGMQAQTTRDSRRAQNEMGIVSRAPSTPSMLSSNYSPRRPSGPRGSRSPCFGAEPHYNSAPTYQIPERQPSPIGLATPSPTTPGSGRRWGLFGSRKKASQPDGDAEEKTLVTKKSITVLRKPAKYKSTPDLVHATRNADRQEARSPLTLGRNFQPPPPVLPLPPSRRLAFVEEPEEDSSIYLTVDPTWDGFTGDVTLFFIPPPERIPAQGNLTRMYSFDASSSMSPELNQSPVNRRDRVHRRQLAQAPCHYVGEPNASFLQL